jgi:hypothetical protein
MSGRARAAWEAAAAHEASGAARDAAGLLRVVGNDAYRTGQFLVAARVSHASWQGMQARGMRGGLVGKSRRYCWAGMPSNAATTAGHRSRLIGSLADGLVYGLVYGGAFDGSQHINCWTCHFLLSLLAWAPASKRLRESCTTKCARTHAGECPCFAYLQLKKPSHKHTPIPPFARATHTNTKAFDALERRDPDPRYWEAKQGAAVGVFQAVIAGGWGTSPDPGEGRRRPPRLRLVTRYPGAAGAAAAAWSGDGRRAALAEVAAVLGRPTGKHSRTH